MSSNEPSQPSSQSGGSLTQPTPTLAGSSEFLGVSPFEYHYPDSRSPALLSDGIIIRKQCLYSLYGPNMSGKSTMIRLLSGTLSSPAVRLEIGGVPIKRPSPEGMRKRGVVASHQGDVMFPELSIWDNIRLTVPNGVAYKAHSAAVHARVHNLLDGHHSLSTHLSALSGGYRALIRLLRTAGWGFSLLLLDEPTVGLDSESRDRFFAFLSELLAANQNAAVVAVSHIQEDHDALCTIAATSSFARGEFHIKDKELVER